MLFVVAYLPPVLSWTILLTAWPHRLFCWWKVMGGQQVEEMYHLGKSGWRISMWDGCWFILIPADQKLKEFCKYPSGLGLVILNQCLYLYDRIILLFFLTLCTATKSCYYYSILTALSSFCGYIYRLYVLTFLWVNR